jgi:hypothetical protein
MLDHDHIKWLDRSEALTEVLFVVALIVVAVFFA